MGRYIGPGDIVANAIGLTPDKIVSGNTILGIEGTASGESLDTSDATATTNDIAKGKTAYVNGEKIEGTVRTVNNMVGQGVTLDYITNFADDIALVMSKAMSEDRLYRAGSYMNMQLPHSDIVAYGKITSDKIVAGETILGVEGTAKLNGSQDIKLFKNEDEMNADISSPEGTLGVVYSAGGSAILPDAMFDNVYLPKTIILDEAVVSDIIVDGDYKFLRDIQVNSGYITINFVTEDYSFYEYVRYDSMDGITYTRNDPNGTSPFEEWSLQEAGFTWSNDVLYLNSYRSVSFSFPDDAVGESVIKQVFMTYSNDFLGLYEYKTKNDILAWHLAETSFSLRDGSGLLPGLTAYGYNGVVTGNESVYKNVNALDYTKAIGIDVLGGDGVLGVTNIPGIEVGDLSEIGSDWLAEYKLNNDIPIEGDVHVVSSGYVALTSKNGVRADYYDKDGKLLHQVSYDITAPNHTSKVIEDETGIHIIMSLSTKKIILIDILEEVSNVHEITLGAVYDIDGAVYRDGWWYMFTFDNSATQLTIHKVSFDTTATPSPLNTLTCSTVTLNTCVYEGDIYIMYCNYYNYPNRTYALHKIDKDDIDTELKVFTDMTTLCHNGYIIGDGHVYKLNDLTTSIADWVYVPNTQFKFTNHAWYYEGDVNYILSSSFEGLHYQNAAGVILYGPIGGGDVISDYLGCYDSRVIGPHFDEEKKEMTGMLRVRRTSNDTEPIYYHVKISFAKGYSPEGVGTMVQQLGNYTGHVYVSRRGLLFE